MNKKYFSALLCVVLSLVLFVCAITGLVIKSSKSKNSCDEATADSASIDPSSYDYKSNSLTLKQGETQFLALTDEENAKLKKWTSSDEAVVSVDDGGRIDALKIGKTNIIAEFTDNTKMEYSIVVKDADKDNTDRFSTCITANEDILESNKKNNSKKNLYEIRVNRHMNCVTVYTYDENGFYTVPVRAMVCSTGKNNSTITGTYSLNFKAVWHGLYNDVYGQYVSGIYEDYLFHSVPYYSISPSNLEVDEFNKLGKQASLGCVRMAISDTKWIYENCCEGTTVIIYDDYNPGPLGKPEVIRIRNKSCGWDPTDDNIYNPYYYVNPVIYGATDCTIEVGGKFRPLNGVVAYDTCSNDITDRITVTGNVMTSRKGSYKVTYKVTDALHRTALIDITVNVV